LERDVIDVSVRKVYIGENFAYVQIKTIIAYFLRQFPLLDLKRIGEDEQRSGIDKENEERPVLFPKMDYTSLIVVPERGSILKFGREE
jgi:hypothetical protein